MAIQGRHCGLDIPDMSSLVCLAFNHAGLFQTHLYQAGSRPSPGYFHCLLSEALASRILGKCSGAKSQAGLELTL